MTTAGRAQATGYGTGRERLVVAARELLVESGGDLDVEVVAARAGVAKSLIWRHFGNRGGLLAAVVEEFWDGYDKAVADRQLTPGSDWAGRERERLGRLVDFLLDHPLAAVVLSHVEGDAALHRVIKGGRLKRHIKLAAANIRRGQDAGLIDETLDADLVAAVIVGGIHEALSMALTARRRPDRAHVVETLWEAVAAILRLPAA
jgi:AcrR family transcriptional regulator